MLKEIQSVIQFIEKNYQRTIPISELEGVAHYSYRNLQRVFKNIFKESLGAFQKRLKLELGYKRLIYTQDPITDIALEAGFESLQAFTKSFKQTFQINPSEARKNKLEVFKTFIDIENQSIKYELIFLPKLKVHYQSIKTYDYRNEDINELWNVLEQDLEVSKGIHYYGVIVDQPLITVKSHCRYEACVHQKNAPNGFLSKNIFGGKYAKYIHYGDFDQIETTYRRIYKDWLFHSTLEWDDSPIIEHYVLHDSNCSNKNDFITEILIPLKKRFPRE
jgi:AraC family transcriptional regulator